MSHLISFKAEGFQRIVVAEITPKGAVTIVSGKNRQGKSSLLRALTVLLEGKVKAPDAPVNRDEKKATLIGTFKMDEWDAFNGTLTVKRTITEAGTWSIEVSSADGAIYKSPQAVLEKIFGKTLDPSEFARAPMKRRVEMLRDLTGTDFTALDVERDKIYDQRTIINREVTRLKGVLTALPFYPEAPAEEVPVMSPEIEVQEVKPELLSLAGLNDELDRARATNESNAKSRRAYNEFLADLGAKTRAVQDVLDEIARLTALLPELEHQRDAAQAEMEIKAKEQEALIDIDEAEIKARIASAEGVNAAVQAEVDAINKAARDEAAAKFRAYAENAQAVNKKVQANAAHAKAKAELAQAEAESNAKTAAIEDVDARKAALLAACPIPVEGLTFDSSGVWYKGLPFDEDQLSTSEIITVSFQLALAFNPALKLMLIKNGADFDEDSLALLESLAEQHGVDIIVEVVGEKKNSIVIEGGYIKADEV